jgi:hypothetical protein
MNDREKLELLYKKAMILLHACEVIQHGSLEEVDTYRKIVEKRWEKLLDAILLFKDKEGRDITLENLDD